MLSGKEFRDDMAWRASFATGGRWGIPVVRRTPPPQSDVGLVALSDTRPSDAPANTRKGVHFFVDDPRFEGIYSHPEKLLPKLAQYSFLLTPDYSVYGDMKPWMQIASVGKSRWVGAYWQSVGLTVYPTVSWGTPQTFEFCFDGIEKHSTVAVGMVGSKGDGTKGGFLRGYFEMLKRLNPERVICFGEPYPEMRAVTDVVDYMRSRKVAR